MIRNLNISALFEPGVPGNTHAHELGKFFSSESRRVSLWNRGEAKLFGTQARATSAQKIGESALPELRAGAEERGRPVPPIIAHVRVALSIDEEKVRSKMRQGVQFAARFNSFTRMWVSAGFPRAAEGNEEEIDALARTLVISGTEETIRHHLKELLASGLDELMLQLVPIVDEERERKQLIHLVGSL